MVFLKMYLLSLSHTPGVKSISQTASKYEVLEPDIFSLQLYQCGVFILVHCEISSLLFQFYSRKTYILLEDEFIH